MTSLDIPSRETGTVRLFAIDLEEREIEGFAGQVFGSGNGAHVWPLRDALGATYLDHEYIEVIRLKDLASVGLTDYLHEGIGLAEETLTSHKAQLDALTGHVLIVLSRAFDGVAQTLDPKPPLRLLETFQEPKVAPSYDPLHADAAQGRVAPMPDAAEVPKGRSAPSGAIILLAVLLGAALVLALTFGAT